MILPGLEPHHTRQGFGSRSRLYVEKYAPNVDNFIESPRGLWLLPESIAEWDRSAGEASLANIAEVQASHDMKKHADGSLKGARILGRTAITPYGCMVGGLRGNQRTEDWTLYFAENEWGGPVFTEADELEYLSACGESDCYNPRHYDIEFGRPTLRERKVEINHRYYEEREDGKIETIWGDVLPSVSDSLGYYIDFQRRNYPFVPIDQSILTATSMSQIRFHPVTGCWESWQYYCKPEDNLNWQFDGYGRLYQKITVQEIDHETGEITSTQRRGHWMAHRVVWLASGRQFEKGQVLNHLCSYRRCCNPLHLEQVSYSENNHHGRRVQAAIRNFRNEHGLEDEPRTTYTHPRELAVVSGKVTELYFDLAA